MEVMAEQWRLCRRRSELEGGLERQRRENHRIDIGAAESHREILYLTLVWRVDRVETVHVQKRQKLGQTVLDLPGYLDTINIRPIQSLCSPSLFTASLSSHKSLPPSRSLFFSHRPILQSHPHSVVKHLPPISSLPSNPSIPPIPPGCASSPPHTETSTYVPSFFPRTARRSTRSSCLLHLRPPCSVFTVPPHPPRLVRLLLDGPSSRMFHTSIRPPGLSPSQSALRLPESDAQKNKHSALRPETSQSDPAVRTPLPCARDCHST